MSDIKNAFNLHRQAHLEAFQQLDALNDVMETLVQKCIHCFNNNGKILLFGNGGSASDAQHIAAEFVVRYKRQRKTLPAIALTTDTSILTAHSNDFGFDTVFQRQVEAFTQPNDIVIGISTSGSSRNVCLGLQAAQASGAYSVAFIGPNIGAATEYADMVVNAPGNETARVQEVHIFLGHFLCDMIDQTFSEE